MTADLAMLLALKILAVLVLVLLNGFFVAAEFALVKIRDTQLDPLIAKGQRRAAVVRHLIQHLDAYLSAAQLGITLASLGLGWIGEPIFADLLKPAFDLFNVTSETVRHSIAFAVGFSVITFLHIVAGEQAPKSFGIRHPLTTALWVAYPMKWFRTAAYPFIWLLNESSLRLLRLAGIEPASEGGERHSEEELRLLLAAAQERAGATALGRNIVLNALDLRRRVVREVMRPRQEIVGLNTQAKIGECLDLVEKTRYSRFPLCEDGEVDRTVGVVHIKDLYALRTKAKTGAELSATARKIIFVPETARLEKVLQLLLERKLHFVFVVDEYGGTAGMLTLENILEELVGQIQDEFDQEKPLAVKLGEGCWELDGQLPLHELAGLVGESLAEEGVTTVSGWVTHKLGGFPKNGDELSVGSHQLRVEAMDGMRVATLKLQLNSLPEGSGTPA
jgi:CBS domain containing-hemolysin-like protein